MGLAPIKLTNLQFHLTSASALSANRDRMYEPLFFFRFSIQLTPKCDDFISIEHSQVGHISVSSRLQPETALRSFPPLQGRHTRRLPGHPELLRALPRAEHRPLQLGNAFCVHLVLEHTRYRSHQTITLPRLLDTLPMTAPHTHAATINQTYKHMKPMFAHRPRHLATRATPRFNNDSS